MKKEKYKCEVCGNESTNMNKLKVIGYERIGINYYWGCYMYCLNCAEYVEKGIENLIYKRVKNDNE